MPHFNIKTIVHGAGISIMSYNHIMYLIMRVPILILKIFVLIEMASATTVMTNFGFVHVDGLVQERCNSIGVTPFLH